MFFARCWCNQLYSSRCPTSSALVFDIAFQTCHECPEQSCTKGMTFNPVSVSPVWQLSRFQRKLWLRKSLCTDHEKFLHAPARQKLDSFRVRNFHEAVVLEYIENMRIDWYYFCQHHTHSKLAALFSTLFSLQMLWNWKCQSMKSWFPMCLLLGSPNPGKVILHVFKICLDLHFARTVFVSLKYSADLNESIFRYSFFYICFMSFQLCVIGNAQLNLLSSKGNFIQYFPVPALQRSSFAQHFQLVLLCTLYLEK